VTLDPTDESRPGRDPAEDFAALVEAEYEASMRFAMSMLRHRADAEDAVQEAFLRATSLRSRYDPERPFHAWLFRILVNQCRTTLLQRGRRARWFSHDPDLVYEAPDPAGQSPAPDEPLARALTAALDALEPLLREAFLLKYVEQMDYAAISEVTGASISALKMRVKRAADQMRPLLEGVRDD
jgi:RNA polymerase sigma-70 factor, ECF subfamily